MTAQSFERYDIAFSGGASWYVGQSFQGNATPVSLGATGGFRVTPAVELEAGVFGAINPVTASCGYFGCFTPDSHFYLGPIWSPFDISFP